MHVKRTVTTDIQGFFGAELAPVEDARGSFTKIFNSEALRDLLGRAVSCAESYLTVSKPGVVRGMHFQIPPSDHAKLVLCLEGSVLDVALDLRRSSKTYREATSVSLSANGVQLAILEKGLAHGFLALETSKLLYLTETAYDPKCDQGIAWNSFGFDWKRINPQLSERDQKHPALQDFASPFA